MIAIDQPTIFGDDIVVAFSERSDGTMLDRTIGRHAPKIVRHRQDFLAQNGLEYDDVVYQVVSYQGDATYNTCAIVDDRHTVKYGEGGVVADALIADRSGIALFLPVADCVATALYDPTHGVIATLHLGRHSTLTDLVRRVVGTMTAVYGTNPADVLAWLSPSVQQASYPMDYFDAADQPAWHDFVDRRDGKYYIDLSGYNRARLLDAGLAAEHIQVSSVDTATDDTYFCHSRGDTTGRMALVVARAAG